jgi:prepilin-type N-terminal cleavage/methylation domain-containing protein
MSGAGHSYKLISFMIKNTLKRGFTLIELLVVIAIIGILASVVLASLNSARDKGEDAATKSNLNNARAQAALFYDENSNSYDDVCADAGGISQFVPDGGVCYADADNWAASAPLTASSSHYCVDSAGASHETGAALGSGDVVCPAS